MAANANSNLFGNASSSPRFAWQAWFLLLPIGWIVFATGFRLAFDEASPLPTDEAGYFVWQWSWLSDGDVDPTDELAVLDRGNFTQWVTQPGGRRVRVDKYSTGLSQAVLPITSIAYGGAWARHAWLGGPALVTIDLPLLTRAAWVAVALWSVAGLLACYGVARHLTSPTTAVIATIGAWAGTSAIAYACKLQLYVHATGMSVLAMIVYLLIVCAVPAAIARNAWRVAIAFGLLVGLAVVLRPTNVILLLPVAIIALQRWRTAMGIAPRHAIAFAMIAVIAALPPLAVEAWNRAANYGSIFFEGYHHNGEFFDLTSPHAGQVLFYFASLQGYGLGLLPAHPITMAALAGLLMAACRLRGERRMLALGGALAISISVYLYGAWSCWDLGFGYGARWAADLLIFWTIGLAWLIHFTSRFPRRSLIYVLPLAVWSMWVCTASVTAATPTPSTSTKMTPFTESHTAATN